MPEGEVSSVVSVTGKDVPNNNTLAERFLVEQRQANNLQEAQAATAMEDAIIQRHRVTTGRTFNDRDKDLKDALKWRADEEIAEKDKIDEVIRQQTKFAEQRANESDVAPHTETKPPNFFQRMKVYAQNIIGGK